MSATLLEAISVGHVIDGRFPLLQQLGGTKWTSAWLTELDDGRGQKAAIKIFPFEAADARGTIDRWDVARTLSHPHLMPLFAAGRCEVDGEGALYVVTEYADETLSQILPERPLSPEEAREMLGPVLDALSYLHKHGLTHGHLRPTNIMAIDDCLKLSPDFGWQSRARSVYDAPESGAGDVNSAADVWSLGILLVEALTQRTPLWNGWRGGEPEVPSTVPEPFFTICRECLRTDPARRCTVTDIQALLNPPKAAEAAVEADDPIADSAVDRGAKRSYGFAAMVFAGGVLFVLFLIAAFRFGWDLTPSSPWPAPLHLLSQATVPAPPAEIARAVSAARDVEQTPGPATAAAPQKPGVVKGWVAQQVLPEIPEKTLSAIQGRIVVVVRVEVDAKGTVSAAFVESPGPSVYFANEALEAAQNWTFIPAQVDGRAAASRWLLKFQFDSSKSAATESEVSP